MIRKASLLIFIWGSILCKEIVINTVNTGNRFSTITPDIVNYYTPLADFGIVPTDEKSLRFKVKACSYAYLLFADSGDIKNAVEFYEIVLGGTRGTENKLRRRYRNGNNVILVKKTTKSLNCNEYRTFNINWTNHGKIQVGTYPNAVMEITDSDPIPVNGFGIRTAFSQNGVWIFELREQEKAHKSQCWCPCTSTPQPYVLPVNRTREELLEILKPKLEAIKKELQINKYNLSMSRRRRTSAPDNRKSAKQLGIVGIVFLVFVLSLIVLIDISALSRICRKPTITPTG